MNKIFDEYKSLSNEKRISKLESLYKEYFVLRQKKSIGSIKDNHLFKKCRRNIARLKTLMNNGDKNV